MRPQKVLDTEIMAGLTKVFRSKGYEGASMKDLAEATGLKKASLYHRFPNGKQEMAEAVLNHIGEWVEGNIFQAFADEEVSAPIRLKNGISQIQQLYHGGEETCIFRALSMQAGLDLFDAQIQNGMQEWISAFYKLGLALDLPIKQAQALAIQSLIDIQGSLIVAKGLNDITIFETTLQKIESHYLKA
ncbi:MAG: TetR/AcrR family transcriptional regulator [Bacteroidota bacterium]